MFKRYLFAGLLVWLPIWITILVVRFLINIMDETLLLLPARYHPDYLLGFQIPGLGLVVSMIVIFLTGLLATNFLGRRLVALGESILSHIPVARTIYSAVKQVLETVLSSSAKSFRHVLLVQYPRIGIWTVAFQTVEATKPFNEPANADLVTIFIPTTPNPTSGFIMMIDKKDTIILDMTVDDAVKWLISLGVMQPGVSPAKLKKK